MSKYELGVIDAEWNLRRLWIVQKSHGELNRELLLKIFMQSIMKMKRDFDFERPLLLWDSAPYYKQLEAVEEYKQNREYTTESDIDALKERLEYPLLSDEEIAEIKAKIEQAEKDIEEYHIRRDVKYELVGNGGDLGFISLIKKHFEADDIAFAVCEKVRELGKSAILVTTDHDWVTFRSKEVDYTTPKGDHRNQNCRDHVLDSRRLNIPLYEIGILKEMYYASHNNVPLYKFSNIVPFDVFCTKLLSEDETLPDYKAMRDMFNAMNIRKHIPELDNLINFSLLPRKYDLSKWTDYIHKKGINISTSSYISFMKDCEKDFSIKEKPKDGERTD